MIKKTILSFLLLMASAILIAGEVPMSPYDDEPKDGQPHRGPMNLPTVFYDNDVLEVSNSFSLTQVTMIIRNDEGDVIAFSTFNVDTYYSTILSNDVADEMYSIELYYDNIHLIGYF